MNRNIYLIFVLALISFLVLFHSLQGNNISVTYDYLTGQNTTDGYTYIQFDICWENSWRRDHSSQNYYDAPYNWDAAWVFVKYRVNNAGSTPEPWKHASLSATQSEHTYPADALVKPASDQSGVFIYSNNNQVGDVSYDDIQLRWEYADDGVSNNDVVEIKVFAIEMVYIPEGSFYVGNDGNEVDKFTKTEIISSATPPSGKNIGASFPNGYNALYMMKYEISQEQYVDFLNTIDPGNAGNCFDATISQARYAITESNGVYSTLNSTVACNFISGAEAQAYAAFAGLRPMTEMEYEKAARGNQNPLKDDGAWGVALSSNSQVVASGGDDIFDIVQNGKSYRVHKYTTVGISDFEVTSGGGVEYLIVAGGGGGGSYGGGGAGGLLTNSGNALLSLSDVSYEIVVGDGGSGTSENQAGSNGSKSKLIDNDNIVIKEAIGGGGGASGNTGKNASSGGSGGGGGAASTNSNNSGAGGTINQGNPGGDGTSASIVNNGTAYLGGGGGGAGSPGGDYNTTDLSAGDGGDGLLNNITGLSVCYAGGGGGGSYIHTPGDGGSGGGGDGGANLSGREVNGAANTGGGGGASRNGSGSATLTSGDGGSGVVIIRYQIPGVSKKNYGIANAGADNEKINLNYAINLGNALHSNNSTNFSGPARVGIFATNNSNRTQSGASYYGVMELSGNLWEQAIPVNQTYDGTHGDGSLSTPTNWTTMGKRGGSWNTPIERLRVSDRDQATTTSGRNAATGFRAVRTAP